MKERKNVPCIRLDECQKWALSNLSHNPPKKTHSFAHIDLFFTDVVFLPTDKDHNGSLSWAELNRAGFAVDRVTFKKIDKDRSGEIDLPELMRVVFPRASKRDIEFAVTHWSTKGPSRHTPRKKGLPIMETLSEEDREELLEIFASIHGSHEGEITRAELRRATNRRRLSDEMLDEIFDMCDTKNTGKLSIADFAEMMSALFEDLPEAPKVTYYFQGRGGAPVAAMPVDPDAGL
eukprot:RCo029352